MSTKFYVYALISLNNSNLYIGQTNNLERRIKQHKSGKVLSTKPYIPYRLLFEESFSDRKNAVAKEKELKSSQGRRFLRSLL